MKIPKINLFRKNNSLSAPFQKVLLENELMPVGLGEKAVSAHFNVSKFDRLHFHISGGNASIADLKIRILFATPVDTLDPLTNKKINLLTGSTIWFESSANEIEFSYTLPNTFAGTGFTMSVPVVAPFLYALFVTNLAPRNVRLFITVMAQEI